MNDWDLYKSKLFILESNSMIKQDNLPVHAITRPVRAKNNKVGAIGFSCAILVRFKDYFCIRGKNLGMRTDSILSCFTQSKMSTPGELGFRSLTQR